MKTRSGLKNGGSEARRSGVELGLSPRSGFGVVSTTGGKTFGTTKKVSNNSLGVMGVAHDIGEQQGGSLEEIGGASGTSGDAHGALGDPPSFPGGSSDVGQSPVHGSEKRLIKDLDDTSSRGEREVARGPDGGLVNDGGDCSKVASIFSSFQYDEDITELISLYRIPPSVLCRHAEADESACCNSPDEIVLYEGMLDAGLRFPIPGSICRVLEHLSLVPGKLAPNGWRVILAFFALWRLTHGVSVPPPFEEFLATYTLSENPTPHQGWYRFFPRSGKFITGLTSNLHKWKGKFFFVGGEWASDSDRIKVPTRWDIVPNTKQAPPTLTDEQKRLLETVRNNPAREHSEIMLAAGYSMAPSRLKKRGTPFDRSIVEDVCASRTVSSLPPPKRARTDPPGLAGPAETELGGAPPPSLTHIPSSPRGGEGPSRCSPQGDARASMLHNAELARERFRAFVTDVETQEIASRGPVGAINATVEGFALVAAALPYLFNNTLQVEDVVHGLATEKQTRSVAEEQLRLERRAREDVEKRLGFERQTRESATEQLRLSQEKAARLEADLRVAVERAIRAEAQRDAAERARARAERARASAFVDGYEELRRKASATFPYCDLSNLKPYEAPKSDDKGDYVSGGSESQ